MISRRSFLKDTLASGTGLALSLHGPRPAIAQTSAAQLERNKAVVRRFKELQGTNDAQLIEREVLAPDYKRRRGGMANLAANAEGQNFPASGSNLRGAFPDRVDHIEEVIAEGDMVGMLFRIQGTHKGNLFGIPATGKTIDVYELGIFRLAEGKITEAWFMADEAGVLLQLGAKLPLRSDGKLVVPPLTGVGADAEVVIKRLAAGSLATPEDRNRLLIARSKGVVPLPKENVAADFRQTRVGFQHLREYGDRKAVSNQNITAAMPERADRIEGFIAEGEKVWMRFKLAAVHSKPLYGISPTGKRVEMPEVGIMRVVEGKWKESWYFGDELGLLLQLGLVNEILG